MSLNQAGRDSTFTVDNPVLRPGRASGTSAQDIEMRPNPAARRPAAGVRHGAGSQRALLSLHATGTTAGSPTSREGPRRMSSSIRRWFHRGSPNKPSAASSAAAPAPPAAPEAGEYAVLTHLKGIPLREGLQRLYKIRRDKFLGEMMLFMVFFFVFLYIVLEAYPVHTAYVQGAALMELLVDEEFPNSAFKKNFHELETMEDYWSWARGPLLAGMFATEWYNGVPFTEQDLGYVQSYDRLVGPVQLRQLRVGNDSCSTRRFLNFGQRFDTKDGTCFAEFRLGNLLEPSTQATEPFGPPWDPERYTWTDNHGLLWGLYGFGPQNYGDGGYMTYLAGNQSQASTVLDQLFRDRWVDKGTRAIAHTMNLYNTNTRLLTVVRIMVEFFPSGYLQGSWTVFSTRLVLYHSRLALLRATLEIVFLLLWVYQLQKEVKRCYHTHPRMLYFLQPRNVFEILFLSVNFGMILSWVKYVTNSRRRNFDVTREEYVDYFPMAYEFVIAFSFAAFSGLLSCLKLFKFLSINKRMSTLWITLQRAMYDLIMFFGGFVFIIVGFGICGFFLFGHALRDFHTVPASISSLTRFMLSDFNYDELAIARPLLAPVFFWLYNTVVFLVVMNMFIAIITLYFEEVHRDAKLSDRWKEGMPDLLYDVIKHLRRFGRRHCQGRLRWCYLLFCCVVCRSKFRKRKMTQPTDKLRSASGLTMQMEVWEREAAFEHLFREASRAAKHRHRSVDLFRYFERAFREASGKANQYIGLPELCMLTSDFRDCPHNDCLARALIYSYGNLKDVVLLRGSERHSRPVTLSSTGAHMFEVVKINKWGRKQRRILSVDPEKQEMLGYDMMNNLKRVLPLSALVQIDKSVPDARRLNLVFAEPIGTQYHLLFQTETGRNLFVAKVFEAVRGQSLDESDDDSDAGSGIRTPSSVGSAGGGAVPRNVPPVHGAAGGESKARPPSTSSRVVAAAAAPSHVPLHPRAQSERRLHPHAPVHPPQASLADDMQAMRQTVMAMKRSLDGLGTQVRRQSLAILPQTRYNSDDDW